MGTLPYEKRWSQAGLFPSGYTNKTSEPGKSGKIIASRPSVALEWLSRCDQVSVDRVEE
jgi:hypothetical protein